VVSSEPVEPDWEGHDRQQCERRDADPPAPSPGFQEAHPYSEEARQQYEVRQELQIDVVGSRPPDQRQLEEQHQEAGADEPGTRPVRSDRRRSEVLHVGSG
jgi:hypothetical protein